LKRFSTSVAALLIAVSPTAIVPAAKAQAAASPAPAAQSSQAPDANATPAPSDATAQQAATAPAAPAQAGGSIRGTIRSGAAAANPEKAEPSKAEQEKAAKSGVPLPGVSVTATNALTGDKYTTVTDATGEFAMVVPRDGRYVVRSELAAFAAGTKSVLLNASNREARVDLNMELQSRVQAGGTEAIAGASAMGLNARGTQALSLLGANAGALAAGVGGGQATLPSASGADTGSDSVSISGATGSTSAAFNFDAARQSMEDDRALQRSTQAQGSGNGSGGGAGAGPGGGFGFLMGGRPPGGGGAGAFRRFNPNAIHGSVVYQLTNSALNARNFSVSGVPESQPGYGTNRYGLVYSGPVIPKLLETDRDFLFLALIGNHGSTLTDQSSNVPTADQRAGYFPTTTPIFNPYTGNEYPTATAPDGSAAIQIPMAGTAACTAVGNVGCISPISQALLPYIPLPNETATTGADYNYRLLESQHTNTDQVSARYIHNFGQTSGGAMPMFMRGGGGGNSPTLRQNLNASFQFQHTSEDENQLFPDFGGKDQLYQYVLNLNYTVSKGHWNNTITAAMNHTDSESRNFFTDINNVAGNAGIQGVGLTPFFYGLPSLQFSGYGSGSEQQPSSRVQEVAQVTENFGLIHKDHNFRFGGDIRRIFLNVIGGANGSGTGALTFSGFATAPPGTTQGDAFADYLIGVPQQGTLQAPCAGSVPANVCTPGSPQYRLRADEFSLYAQDTWHANANLTILYGLRYEYFSPYSELSDRMANLDPNATFTDVAVVTPNEIGPYNGKYPHSLVDVFRDGLAPRLGLAWKAAKNTVVRAGYGINYNTSVYGNFVQDLAYQSPFALANNNTQATVGTFTIANALTNLGNSNCQTPPCITNNYAVEKNYRMGYVQGWNMDIQQTLGKGFLLNVGYNGSKGTHLDGLLSPNRILNYGASTPNAQPFDYEVSSAQSNFNALAVRLRKRLQGGIAIGATYTYAHSIDDASTIGGTSAVVAQQPLNLIGDMGNSSFDQRHVLKGDSTYELPFGPSGKYLNNGNWISHALAGLQLYGDFNIATGTPLNPYYEAASGEVSSGVTGSLRPDRISGSSLEGGPSQLAEWFNVNAYLAPCRLTAGTTTMLYLTSNCVPATYHFGSAARNSIPGPGTREFDMAFSKYVSFGDVRSLEFRATVNNIFNLVQYSNVTTALDSPHAGQVSSAAAMRNAQVIVRYRF